MAPWGGPDSPWRGLLEALGTFLEMVACEHHWLQKIIRQLKINSLLHQPGKYLDLMFSHQSLPNMSPPTMSAQNPIHHVSFAERDPVFCWSMLSI